MPLKHGISCQMSRAAPKLRRCEELFDSRAKFWLVVGCGDSCQVEPIAVVMCLERMTNQTQKRIGRLAAVCPRPFEWSLASFLDYFDAGRCAGRVLSISFTSFEGLVLVPVPRRRGYGTDFPAQGPRPTHTGSGSGLELEIGHAKGSQAPS
jgi:hypothetical protein